MSEVIISADLRNEFPVIKRLINQLIDIGYADSVTAVSNELKKRHGQKAIDALLHERDNEAA